MNTEISQLEGDGLLHAEDSDDQVDVTETLAAAEEAVAPEATFADYGVRDDIVGSLADAGILHPFPIQAMTLPVALDGHDIIGQAKTGTGKTLGFGIPALQRVISPGEDGWDQLPAPGAPQALIVAPTRELAVQVAGDLETASRRKGTRIATIYGGRAYEPQIEALQAGVEIVVGTPGRLIDLYQKRHLSLKNVRIVVLDEADEMLDLGFLPDVETLMGAVPAIRQTLLFSATMPGPVVAMARRYMSKPTHIRAADPADEGLTKKDIRQVVYRAHHLDKIEVVARLLQANGRGRTIIFTKTKRTAAKVTEELVDRGFAAAALHGDLGQGAREQAMRAFRNEKVDVLVATDVAARGIDVDDVTHVINYQAEPVETYSSSPHLYTDLDIPAGTKGRLPRAKRKLAGIDAERIEDLGETGKSRSRGGDRGGDRGGRGGDRGGRGGDRDRGGRRSERTERAPRAAAAEGAPAEAPAASDEARSERPRRRRSRTRRRNGEVVQQRPAGE